ncbi:MAG: FadR/GntR family transcriptional regulator [Devosia sp.]|nr:FadR/GntR family transcriptional regulator [Devosia sp.]
MNDAAPRKRDEGGTATSNVADELVRMILGELTPGASLPSEAELALQHGVSRVTVREAVKMVAGRGLLELARGRRAVVREPSGVALGEYMTWILQHDPKGVFDLVEVRMSLEVQSVGLAAKRATRPAIAAIESTLAAMREAAAAMDEADGDEDAELAFHRADVGFHEAIALAGGNRILVSLFEAMAQSLQRSFFMTRRGRQLRGQTSCDTIMSHQRILNCIKIGDVPGAEAAMRVHLTDAAQDMRAALVGTF